MKRERERERRSTHLEPHLPEELLIILVRPRSDRVRRQHDLDVLVSNELVSEFCSIRLGSVVGLDLDVGAEALEFSSPVFESGGADVNREGQLSSF